MLYAGKRGDKLMEEIISIYQCKTRSHIAPLNFNLRFGGDCGRIEFVPIVDLLGIVSDSHFYASRERIENISNDSPNNERF